VSETPPEDVGKISIVRCIAEYFEQHVIEVDHAALSFDGCVPLENALHSVDSTVRATTCPARSARVSVWPNSTRHRPRNFAVCPVQDFAATVEAVLILGVAQESSPVA